MQNFIDELMVTINFDGTIERRHVSKPNGQELTGLVFVKPDSCMSPTVYAEELFADYQNGATVEEIAKRVENMINQDTPDFDVNDLMTWDSVKDKVIPFLLDKETNENMLDKLLYTETNTNLIECYAIMLDDVGGGKGNVKVFKTYLDMYGITKSELVEQAHKNALDKLEIKSMLDTLIEMMGEDMVEAMGITEDESNSTMYVVSNKDKMLGAGTMFLDKALNEIVRKTGKEMFFILPSSIHEFLVVTDMSFSPNELKDMVMNVNATEVSPKDRLSNNVYKYDGEEVVQIA